MASLRKKVAKMTTSLSKNGGIILFIVFIALLLDSMLLTTIVPIIPDYLYQQDEAAQSSKSPHITLNSTINLAPPSTSFIFNNSNQLSASGSTKNASGDNLNREEFLQDVSVRGGLLFASKAAVQLIANPFVGYITHRIGYTIPLFVGLCILVISTLVFALGESYAVLFVARSLQGLGSSCTSVSGMGMIAQRYTDDKQRGRAMGIALSGLAIGVVIGPTYGGVLYQFVGKGLPFFILAGVACIDGIIQLVVIKPSYAPCKDEKATSIGVLLKDPFILIAAGSIMLSNMGVAMLEPTIPIWMKETMHSTTWQTGMAFLPISLAYLVGTSAFGAFAHKIGRWAASLFGMLLMGGSLIALPFCTTIYVLIVPCLGIGLAIGMIDSSMMPVMGHLVDIRHSQVYGNVYAIADIALCIGFTLGPAISGFIVKGIGFKGLMCGIGAVNVLFAPLLYFLRNPPSKAQSQSLPGAAVEMTVTGGVQKVKQLDESSLKY